MLVLFVVVSVISFLGSVHPGPVNLAVVQTTLSQNRRAGIWLALGGSLPEIAYSVLASSGLMLLPQQSSWTTWLPYLPIPVLLGAGLAAFRQKPVLLGQSVTGGHTPFWKGLTLASVNPQLLPFWSAVWLYLSQAMISGQMLIPAKQIASQWVFAGATAAGAFALLLSVAWLTDYQRERVIQYLSNSWINRLTGAGFIGMALWQAVQLLTNN
jgi:threonine/homoserine/homoserine lactone efflux protein